jgi:anti-sigma regulatory factor (Ser/Thr protein kinase)
MDAVERIFEATLENIPEIVGFVTESAGAMGVHAKRLMHMELAVEEAVVNICSYAYEIPPGEIDVSIKREAEFVRIELIDAGVPFDPLTMEAPDIKSELENREVGGLGIFLLTRVMDEVHYSRKGGLNILSMAVRYGDK